MNKQTYITEEERRKCEKVANALCADRAVLAEYCVFGEIIKWKYCPVH